MDKGKLHLVTSAIVIKFFIVFFLSICNETKLTCDAVLKPSIHRYLSKEKKEDDPLRNGQVGTGHVKEGMNDMNAGRDRQ